MSLDCQYFDREKEKFRVIKSNKVVDPNKEVIVVLSNLAVRRDRRKQKIAQKLLQACENYIRVSTQCVTPEMPRHSLITNMLFLNRIMRIGTTRTFIYK